MMTVAVSAFGDELQKIAEEKPPKYLNKEVFNQFLKNTAAIAGGTAAGYGVGQLTVDQLKRFRGPRSSKLRAALAVGLPVLGGGAAMLYKHKLDQEKERLLEDAYQRGLKARGSVR